MRGLAKILISKGVTKNVLRFFLMFFFDAKYLQGKHFESNVAGWVWALKGIWFQKLLGFNRHVPWPISPSSKVSNCENILFHVDDIGNFQSPGCYFQNFSALIEIGQNTLIGPNVGLITANHELKNVSKHQSGQNIKTGINCWIGMNAVILPGVELGDNTIVGAGSVVTRSFPNGNCVIAGNPAKLVKRLN